jgi:hypothetical protein
MRRWLRSLIDEINGGFLTGLLVLLLIALIIVVVSW